MKKLMKNYNVRSKTTLYVSLGLLLMAGLVIGYVITSNSNQSVKVDPSVTIEIPASTGEVNQGAVTDNTKSQESMLLYLIEEEKLAHDVYTVMYSLYGSSVFGNIIKSEESHQSQVLTLLKVRDITDPRSSELGKFSDASLQKFYNELIAQGKQSKENEFKAGIAIEEKDIADITVQLATATDADIVSTLEALRSGSESHLRAFNRQIGEY
jgi:hypothetical protein